MEKKEELMDRLIAQAEKAGGLSAGEKPLPEPKELKLEEPKPEETEQPKPEDTKPKEPEQPEPKEPEKKEPEPGDLPTKRVRIPREDDANRALKNAIHNEIHAEVVKSYQNTETAIREGNAALSRSVEEAVKESAEASKQRLDELAETTDERLRENAAMTEKKIGDLEERQKASEELQKGNRQWLFLLLILLILNFVISAVLLFR